VPLDTIAVTLDGTFDYLTAPLFLDGPLAVPTPITFHGTLTGVDVSTGALAFRHTLTGTGTASLGQIELGTPPGVLYRFNTDAAPVPEPGTLLLLSSALGGLALRRTRRWQAQRGSSASARTAARN
jgi:PEP-CTERM motif